MDRRQLVSCALAALLGVSAAPALAQAPIKVGAPLAVTGGASFLGDPEKRTIELYADRINKSGGLFGRPLQVIVYDTAGDAKQMVTFVRRLIEEDKVDVLIGGSTTGETMAAVPLAEEAQIPFISLAGASVIVEPVKKWVFKMPHSDRMAIEKIYEHGVKQGLTRFAVIGGDGGFDQSCRKEAHAMAGKWGVTVVADETYASRDTDMTPQLTKIKGAAGVQAIVGCGFGAVTSLTARNWRQLGMNAIPFYFNHGVGSQQFIDGAQGAAEGIRVPVAALLVAQSLQENDRQRAASLAYAAAYKEAFNQPVSTFGGHAFDGLHIYLDAVKRAGGTDKAKVRDALENTRDFVGVDGIYNMSQSDHMGLSLGSFRMVEIRDGTWKLID